MVGLLELVMKISEAMNFSVWEQGTTSDYIPMHDICPLLNTELPKLSYEPQNISRKAYFEYVHLSAIKIVIDFKTAKKGVSLQVDPHQNLAIV
jgi:hypothetical protein